MIKLLVFLIAAAQAQHATVVMVKGKVSAGSRAVGAQQKIPFGSTIQTGAQSAVKLLLPDQTSLRLGPRSRAKLSKDPSGKGRLIELGAGQVRLKVLKKLQKTKGKSKFYVKTRSSVLGVRGTDFEAAYNPQSQNTSVVTYEGEVKIGRLGEDLDSAVDGGVSVEPGEFTHLNPDLKQAATPVRINPAQFEALKTDGSSGRASPRSRSIVPPGIDPTAVATGAVGGAPSQKNSAVLPGGLVDLKTGIYIPPPPGSTYDPNTKTYSAPASMGTISARGEYRAPPGSRLTSKGFTGQLSETKLLGARGNQALEKGADPVTINTQFKSDGAFARLEDEEEFEDEEEWWDDDEYEFCQQCLDENIDINYVEFEFFF